MKTSNEIISEIIEGTIECWKIIAQEECDLKWQLINMVGRCFTELGRDVTFTLAPNTQLDWEAEYLNGRKIVSMEYKCLFGTSHTVVGSDLNELNQNLHNHKCDCDLVKVNLNSEL
jgi:hypothetical protein